MHGPTRISWANPTPFSLLQVLAPLEDRHLAPTAEQALLTVVYRVRRKFGGPA